MAEHLASIFGTEKDRVNCPFYFKIGACRHGDRCGRLHNRPNSSVTLLLSNMYQAPDAGLAQRGGMDAEGNIQQMDPKMLQEHFEDFYEDIFEELSKYGEVENLNVCDNLADHMIGNVYVKFREEEQASAALHAMSGRFYAGRPIMVEFSPVTDFHEATCRQYEENSCNRGGYCNFMHLRKISRDLRRKLFGHYKRSRSRSYSPYGRGDARGSGGVGGGGGGGGGGFRRDGGRPFDDFGGRRGGRGGGFRGRGGGGFRGRGGPGYGFGGGRGRVDRRDYPERADDRRGGYGRERSRSYSPEHRGYGRRERDPGNGREGSAERRAKIEQWNREREQRDAGPPGGLPDGPPGVPSDEYHR